jgi:hypothetical protein
MKYWLMLCVLLTGCSGLQFQNASKHLLVQSRDRQLSCLSGANDSGGSNCCYPYKNKLMICTYVAVNGVGDETGAIVVRLVPDNTGK